MKNTLFLVPCPLRACLLISLDVHGEDKMADSIYQFEIGPSLKSTRHPALNILESSEGRCKGGVTATRHFFSVCVLMHGSRLPYKPSNFMRIMKVLLERLHRKIESYYPDNVLVNFTTPVVTAFYRSRYIKKKNPVSQRLLQQRHNTECVCVVGSWDPRCHVVLREKTNQAALSPVT